MDIRVFRPEDSEVYGSGSNRSVRYILSYMDGAYCPVGFLGAGSSFGFWVFGFSVPRGILIKLPTTIAMIKRTIIQNPNPRFPSAAPISPKNSKGRPITTRRIRANRTQMDIGLNISLDTGNCFVRADIKSIWSPTNRYLNILSCHIH